MGRDAVINRRRQQLVPHDLRIVMGMAVDKTGSDDGASDVKLLFRAFYCFVETVKCSNSLFGRIFRVVKMYASDLKML